MASMTLATYMRRLQALPSNLRMLFVVPDSGGYDCEYIGAESVYPVVVPWCNICEDHGDERCRGPHVWEPVVLATGTL